MHLLPLSCLGSISFFQFSGLLGYLRVLASGRPSSGGYVDPRFKRVLWYLIGSTKGGVNRAKIIELLNSRPANPNQIANELKLDYKTVLHHLKVLSDNGLIITDNKESYGAAYFLTPLMENNYQSFVEILAKIKRSSGNAG
ncbi:putative transcriptional regulator, ArsR family [Candidatus Nitrososphaera gargensis Ga9.2]|uniref:Putative transcriptional regulator, ArsR family n=1 Tax=Nitrososphaera gargensis (strain Ga9.2) TaxID=1237085 RepID=K0IIE0_NITGG|nr:putative transcriptional regulator, ArsR family [Candidatus Nitrososphaera gargensis Ga9.2]